ncbi:MAG TPA: hypothetical protein VEC16_01495 [Alphaproteobacteria bacterium]|nr:hypothetical protein [Alphaproteobacteria bacterium]
MLDNLVKNYHKSIFLGLGMLSLAAIVSLDSCSEKNARIAQLKNYSKPAEEYGEYHGLEMPKDLQKRLVAPIKRTMAYDSVWKLPQIDTDDSIEVVVTRNIDYYAIDASGNNYIIEKYNSIPDKEKYVTFNSSYKFIKRTIGFSNGYNRGKFNYSINGKKMSVDIDKGLTWLVFLEKKWNYTEMSHLLIDGFQIINTMPSLEVGEDDLVLQYKGKRKSLQSLGKITRESFDFPEEDSEEK